MIAALIALTLCLTLFASCGSKTEPAEQDTATTSAEDAMAELDAKLEAYINEPGNVEAIKQLNEQFAGLYTISMKQENHKFIYQFEMAPEAESSAELLAVGVEDGATSTYLKMVDELRRYTGYDDVKLVLRYVDQNGATVYEKEFDKNTELVENADGSSGTETLSAFINSESFQAQMAAQNTDELHILAKTEGEDTMVFVYQIQQAISEDMQDAVRAEEEALVESDSIRESLKTSYTAVKALFPDQDLYLKVIVEDTAGTVFAEKTFTPADFA